MKDILTLIVYERITVFSCMTQAESQLKRMDLLLAEDDGNMAQLTSQ